MKLIFELVLFYGYRGNKEHVFNACDLCLYAPQNFGQDRCHGSFEIYPSCFKQLAYKNHIWYRI